MLGSQQGPVDASQELLLRAYVARPLQKKQVRYCVCIEGSPDG